MILFDMNKLDPRERYQLLTRSVTPRPIAFVSSMSAEGQGNLAPFSYFNLGGANPPSAVICPVKDREARIKDTLRNIQETEEYVINICDRSFVTKMNQTSWSYPPEIDELEATGLTKLDSVKVKPPRVAESAIQMEMKLFKMVEHGDGPLSSNYIIGEILAIHCRESILTDGIPDERKLKPLGRLGGSDYCEISDANIFSIARPAGPDG